MSQTTDDRKAVVRPCLAAWDDEDMETFDEVYARDLTHTVEAMVAEDHRVDDAYRENHERLVELENEWNPENPFRLNSNVEPTTGVER